MLTKKLIALFKDTARKLTGPNKRAFMARVAQMYFDSSARKAESHLGWSRHTVSRGMKEVETVLSVSMIIAPEVVKRRPITFPCWKQISVI